MAEIEPSGPRREIELDLLRGIAILAVVDFHSPVPLLTAPFALLGIPGIGSAGVNIFFVLSGFLVGGLLVKEWRTFGHIDAKRFLIRRGLKIWPQFYLFLLLNLVTQHRSWSVLWPAFLNIQNYSSVTGANVPHLWSLAVEEHAYLLLTFFFVFVCRVRMRFQTVLWLLAATCAIVITLQMVLAAHGKPYVEATHARIQAILYGLMLAILFHLAPQIFHRLQSLRWLWLAGLLLALLYLRFHPQSALASAGSIDVSDLIGVCGLMLLYRHQPGLKRGPIYRFVAWIGLYSYGIYLWSVSVLGPSRSLAQHFPSPLNTVCMAILVPVSGIVLGILMTKLVEFPALRLRDRLFPRRIQSAVETQ